jgi:hypothetical protein
VNSSTASSSLVLGPLGATLIEHVFIGGIGIELREGHAILTTDLTETFVGRISKLTIFGHLLCSIEEFHDVDILGRKLSGVDMEVTKKTASFPEGSYVSTAYKSHSIARLFSSVKPSILLRHGHNFLNRHVFGSSEGSLFGNLESSGT